MPATIPIAFDDFQEWRIAHRLTRWELQKRAVAARRKHEALVLLSKAQFDRWVDGLLTPWRRPDALTVSPLYGPHWSRVIVPEQICEDK